MKPEPTIFRIQDFGDNNFYQLYVPDDWLKSARWPRLTLTWWIIKMAWRVRKA